MRMKKKALNLYVDSYLIEKTKDHGLVISKFLDNQLRSYFEFIEQRQKQFTPYNTNNTTTTISNNTKSKSNNQSIHSEDKTRAYGLVVMTSPSHGGGLRFKSG